MIRLCDAYFCFSLISELTSERKSNPPGRTQIGMHFLKALEKSGIDLIIFIFWISTERLKLSMGKMLVPI